MTPGIRYSLFFCETNARIHVDDFYDLLMPYLNELSFYQMFDHVRNLNLIEQIIEYIETSNIISNSPLSDSRLEYIRHAHILSIDCDMAVNTLMQIIRHNEKFIKSIQKMNLNKIEIIQGINDYRAFLIQLHENRYFEPTNILVDFIWHVHMLDKLRYIEVCNRILGYTVNHIIKI